MSQEKIEQISKQQTTTYQENKRFLSYSYATKEEFSREYKKTFYKNSKIEEFYLLILTEFAKTISEDNIESLKKLSSIINYINSIEDKLILKTFYDNDDNPIKNTNLVILASQNNKLKILEYLFLEDNEILKDLTVDIGRNAILPDDEDETQHNAFYYAIRSGNVELLDTLINKWPDNYFSVHCEELDEILSRAYEELKLMNVPLTQEIQIFVENKLINIRFFSNATKKNRNPKNRLNNIIERINLILQNINLLKAEYSNAEKVDEKFLFIAKFIAKNIHTLKQQLRSTYDRLPWEEIEFCLVSFISCYIKNQEINLFYRAALNKNKILNHLEIFAKRLEEEKDIIKGINTDTFFDLPKRKREKVVTEIINNNPQFEQLYNDYQQIRDIYSLEKIKKYIQLALSVNPKEKEGQLIIIRVLQVIGEYLKNTLESPKLSTTTSELLLLSFPKNTREVIIDLRNTLSHAYSLSKRLEIEENRNVNFFIGVQNDSKKIGDAIIDILNDHKIEVIRILLQKVSDSENLKEIREIAEVFYNTSLDDTILGNFKITKYEKLGKLIEELNDNVKDKTNYEKKLFDKINNIINSIKTKSTNIKNSYVKGFAVLSTMKFMLEYDNIDHNCIRSLKYNVNQMLGNISPAINSKSLEEIAKLSMRIMYSLRLRIENDLYKDDVYKIDKLICEIFHIAKFGTGDVKWIEDLKEKLNDQSSSFIAMDKQKRIYNITEKKYNQQLELKLSELKSILKNNELSEKLIENFSFYKCNKKLQAVVEMLVLDIMSILSSSKNNLENNFLFLDDNTPLLTGKYLRNHLAHDNALVDVFLSDPTLEVILNAKKLSIENIMKSKKKVGKLVKDDPSKLKKKYNQGLITVTNQERMFVAAEEGNLENFKNYVKNGVDIKGRSIDLKTILHFAAKGPNLEIIKFLLNQNLEGDAKDINGQTPLHIAAAYGRESIVEFFIKKVGLNIEDVDQFGRTPLHIAAQNGHNDTVEILLKNKANIAAKDLIGLSPLLIAIRYNHVNIAKILLQKNTNLSIHNNLCGLTPLHEAVERGHLELVNLLLQNRAMVNMKNNIDWIPLHTAAYNGHLEIVNTLIFKGAQVNARGIEGSTPLLCAAENGHEKIVNILLEYGANVNVFDKMYNTPLHYAARDGREEIIKVLLKNNANADIATMMGVTPLHFAAQNNHLKIVIEFLKHGVNIHAKDANDATPFYYAICSGNKEIAELLIKNGATINDKDKNNRIPLHVAALNGYKDITDLLIKNKSDVKARDNYGGTSLHYAAKNDKKDIIDQLMKNGAEVNAKTNDDSTPLHIASISGHIDIISLLIANKAKVNARNNLELTPLHAAITGGHRDAVNFLIMNQAEVNAKGISYCTPLHIAVEEGHKEIVEILIINGADVNVKTDNVTPLMIAIMNGDTEIVEILVKNGANVNADNGRPLSMAVFAGSRDIVKILLDNKAFVNINNQILSPLHIAVSRGYKHITIALIQRGANINARNKDGSTALHIASEAGHEEIVDILLKKGANVKNVTNNKVSPLYFAAQRGHEKVAEVLIANGANVNFVNDEGATPLHAAARFGHENFVSVLLLNNKTKINIRDNEYRTALELAVAYGHLKIVKMLLQQKKIDLNTKGSGDWTILHIASQQGEFEVVKYLVNEGSNIHEKNDIDAKPIHVAAREGFKDVVKFFLDKGMSINEYGRIHQTLLHYAAMNGKLEVVKYLISQGANINVLSDDGLTPTHLADYHGHKEVVQFLLKSGAIYDNSNKFPKRPFKINNMHIFNKNNTNTDIKFECDINEEPKIRPHLQKDIKIAAHKGDTLTIQRLLRNGVDPNDKDIDGRTSLHYAVNSGHVDIVNILLKNGANIVQTTNKGNTPLHTAASKGHKEIVKILLHHVSREQLNDFINAKTTSNATTSLHVAAKGGYFKIVKTLLQYGAIYAIENKEGKIPLDLCKDKKMIDLFKYIEELFRDMKNGNIEVISKLRSVANYDEFSAITNTRNEAGNTLLQIAIANKYKLIVSLLLDMLKRS